MPVMDMELITSETMDMLAKAQTAGINVATGLVGVDLSGLVSLVPVNVPARNNTSAFPRVIAREGAKVTQWRALLNVNASQASAAVGQDFAGSMTNFSEQDVFAPYQVVAKSGRVTLDALAIARNYADALAVAELQTLNQLFIFQDSYILNGQAWPVAPPGTPVVTTSISGGSMPTATAVTVKVAARSGVNYYEGGSSVASAVSATVTTGAGTSNSVTATAPAAVKGAVAYDWYQGVPAGPWYYYGTTTTSSITMTTIIAAPNPAGPTGALPQLSTLMPGVGVAPLAIPPVAGNGQAPTADTSSSPNYYNGFIASTLADYGASGPVQPGTGTPAGAVYIDNGGNAMQLVGGGIDLLDRINDQLWSSVQLSPTAYMVNSKQGQEISQLVLSSQGALTLLPPTDADARSNLAGGGYIGRYVNRAAGGVPVPIEIMTHMPPGTVAARTDRVPFPGSNIGTVFEVRCQYDTMRFDYAANMQPGVSGGGPRWDFEIRSFETLVNRAPGAQAVAVNVA